MVAEFERNQSLSVTKLGDYEVLVGGTTVAFWPLSPDANVYRMPADLVCAPGTASSVNTVVLPVFGIVDVLVRFTEGVISEDIEAPDLPDEVGGKATIKKMPLVQKDDGSAHIRFAVDHAKIAEDGYWEGVLRLRAKYKSAPGTGSCQMEVKLKGKFESAVENLFVFFVAHPKPKKAYAWITAKAVGAADAAVVTGATVDLKVLRDNLAGSGFAVVNRRVALLTDSAGYVSAGNQRIVLAVPVEWPMMFTVEASTYVTRAHMIRLKEDLAKHDNLAPIDVGPIRMTKLKDASLAGRKFVLDAGHGVVYALASARRCQEWYAAHLLADRIAEILCAEHAVNSSDILWTRTAGIGLIEPTQVHHNSAPEAGDNRYKVDLPKKQIAIKLASLGLHDLSALLLTRHTGESDSIVAITEADRNGFLNRNSLTVNAIIARLDSHLASTHDRVQPRSVRWDVGSSRYVFTKERKDSAGNWGVIANTTPLPISATDWFALDADALRILADRSARWSLANEIGSGPIASSGRPDFRAAALAAMRRAGALDYFRENIIRYLDVADPHPYLSHGLKAWGPSDRIAFLNGASAALALSLHENAGGGKGGMILVSHKGGVDAPPADQVRIAKIFVKYLDAFDQGLRQGGVVTDLPSNPAGMLYHGNQIRGSHAYFESEFMDAADPDDDSKYSYEAMITDAYIDRVARQIVCGVVEWLLDPQVDFDAIFYNSSNKIQGLW